jgi:tetratricopeptide (TPR) repeat protein
MKRLALLLAGMWAAASAAIAQPQQTAAERQALADAVNKAVEEGERRLNRQPAEALADFDRAVALAPDWGLGHAFRALALTELRRDDEAGTEMALAERLGPNDPMVHQHAGYRWLMLGEFAASVRSYSRSLELDPNNPWALDRRAQAYRGLGQMDLALADIDRWIAIDAAEPNSYYQRARILAHLGRESEALDAIGQAITGGRQDYYYLAEKGDLLERFGRREEAVAAFEAALAHVDTRVAAMPPGRPAPWVRETRINMLGRAGRLSEAMALIDAELARTPDAPALPAARCWLRMEANIEPALALADCDRALAAEPANPVAAAARARLYLRLQRWAEAEAAFNDLIYLGHGRSEANALYGRGLARIQRGDGAQGERDLREARRRRFDVAWEYARIGLDLAAQPPAN